MHICSAPGMQARRSAHAPQIAAAVEGHEELVPRRVVLEGLGPGEEAIDRVPRPAAEARRDPMASPGSTSRASAPSATPRGARRLTALIVAASTAAPSG